MTGFVFAFQIVLCHGYVLRVYLTAKTGTYFCADINPLQLIYTSLLS